MAKVQVHDVMEATSLRGALLLTAVLGRTSSRSTSATLSGSNSLLSANSMVLIFWQALLVLKGSCSPGRIVLGWLHPDQMVLLTGWAVTLAALCLLLAGMAAMLLSL